MLSFAWIKSCKDFSVFVFWRAWMQDRGYDCCWTRLILFFFTGRLDLGQKKNVFIYSWPNTQPIIRLAITAHHESSRGQLGFSFRMIVCVPMYLDYRVWIARKYPNPSRSKNEHLKSMVITVSPLIKAQVLGTSHMSLSFHHDDFFRGTVSPIRLQSFHTP